MNVFAQHDINCTALSTAECHGFIVYGDIRKANFNLNMYKNMYMREEREEREGKESREKDENRDLGREQERKGRWEGKKSTKNLSKINNSL